MGSSLSVLQYIPAVYRQSFPPKPQFTTEQMPDLTGQVMIVTGAFHRTLKHVRYCDRATSTGGNTGIGRETVKASSVVRVYTSAESSVRV